MTYESLKAAKDRENTGLGGSVSYPLCLFFVLWAAGQAQGLGNARQGLCHLVFGDKSLTADDWDL